MLNDVTNPKKNYYMLHKKYKNIIIHCTETNLKVTLRAFIQIYYC